MTAADLIPPLALPPSAGMALSALNTSSKKQLQVHSHIEVERLRKEIALKKQALKEMDPSQQTGERREMKLSLQVSERDLRIHQLILQNKAQENELKLLREKDARVTHLDIEKDAKLFAVNLKMQQLVLTIEKREEDQKILKDLVRQFIADFKKKDVELIQLRAQIEALKKNEAASN